ncbi:spore coat protein SA [bacterium BMS3Abin05]|nr:spore coat protein SA [bacterium BMS3Abin05]GBE27671.1 spore coat protein SA [bacterium BMS3Bbin03]
MKKNRLKILYIIDQLSFGGSEQHLTQVLRHLDRALFEPHLYVLHGKWDLLPEIEQSGIPCRKIGLPNILTAKAVGKIPYWVREIQRGKFQILHTYLFASNLYGQILGALAGVPVRISSRREMAAWMGRRHIVINRFVNRFVHRWIGVSEAVAESAAAVEKVPRGRLTVIPNGVDVRKFSPSNARNGYFSKANIPDNAPLILNVGSYRPVKGQVTFVQACQRVLSRRPDVHCAIVGEAREPVLSKIRRQLQTGGGGANIHLLPPTNRMERVYPGAALLVSSSYFEGFSNTILEAGASGVPVVATAVGGNPEAVKPGENGLLVPPGNPEKMARAILKLLEKPARRDELKKRSRHFVENTFSLEKMVETMQTYYLKWYDEARRG